MSNSGNKYRSKERDAYYAEVEAELEAAKKARDNPEVVEEEEVLDAEEETSETVGKPVKEVLDVEKTWEKRYGDLRSYHEKEINKLKAEIERSKNAVPSVDMTDEDFAKWMQKYPAVAAAVTKIAKLQAAEMVDGINEKLETVEADRQMNQRQRAYLKLLEVHPDFESIRNDQGFHDWLVEQPAADQKKILEPDAWDDAAVYAAARVIQFYKLESGTSKKPEKKKKDTSAAESVKTKSSSSPDDHSDTPRFTESQIRDMPLREFERLYPQIREAQRKGAPYFIRDLSGAAA